MSTIVDIRTVESLGTVLKEKTGLVIPDTPKRVVFPMLLGTSYTKILDKSDNTEDFYINGIYISKPEAGARFYLYFVIADLIYYDPVVGDTYVGRLSYDLRFMVKSTNSNKSEFHDYLVFYKPVYVPSGKGIYCLCADSPLAFKGIYVQLTCQRNIVRPNF